MTRILIVDDNRTNLYLLEATLKGYGYEVVSAENGQEALDKSMSQSFDLVISDIMMPVMDGFELCRRWKMDKKFQRIPFIIYTATYTEPRDEQLALNLGADRFVIKPQKPENLATLVREVLIEALEKPPVPPESKPLGDEMEVLRQYNEVLFHKLEKKVQQLEEEITERRAAQQQLEKAIRELEWKNAELARFTYTVSHELRNPLITIQGFAGLIKEEVSRGGDASDLKRYVQRISDAVDTLDTLLSDILKLSRAGRSINTPEPVEYGSIVREAVDSFGNSLTGRGIHVDVDPVFPVVVVDRERIRQVLVNLIENAARFRGNRPDPVIHIGTAQKEGESAFFVRDNGIGIDPKFQDRVFNLFEKLDPKSEGNGIGLAIVRRVIEVHGGRIWVESEGEGKGTTFWFTLPVYAKNGNL